MCLLAGAAINWIGVVILLWQRAEADVIATGIYALWCAFTAQAHL